MEQGNAKLVIPFESSRTACAGAAAAYLMRRLAARAGAYAPGIQEHLFFQIGRRPIGTTIDSVDSWLRGNGGTLSHLGYYIVQRRMAAPTEELCSWIEGGGGYRAAVLSVDGRMLKSGPEKSEVTAVGLTLHDATSGIADDKLPDGLGEAGLVMLDPWTSVTPFVAPPETLRMAHLAHKFAALLLYWSGHS